MILKNYTDEQKAMLDKGFTLCVECAKGYKGDKSCGANGHINYDSHSASGCSSGQKLNNHRSFVSTEQDAVSFAVKALEPHNKLIDIEIHIKGQAVVDLKPLFKNADNNICPKSKIKEYLSANVPQIEDDIKDFADKLKNKGILLVEIKGHQKEFDPFIQAMELITKRLI